MSMQKYFRLTAIPLLFFIIIIFFLWRGLHNDPHLIASPLLNKSIPSFSAATTNSATKPITEKIFLNHISILNVFASWCITCVAEHDLLMDIQKQNQLQLIGLNYKDQHEKVLPWLKKYGNPYHQIISDEKGEIAINLGVYGTPESFLIDKQGKIRYKHIGAISPEVWQNILLPKIKSLENET